MMTEDTIFAAAIEKSTPAERTAYLDEACAGDTVLRQRIEALLQSHTDAGSFLGKPAVQLAVEELAGQGCSGETQGEPPSGDEDGKSLDFLAPSEKPGSLGRLGHYEISQVVGRGGMGVVLKAFDETLHRIVAIKVMAPQFSSSATARKRFIREARAAAAVSHDHIVTIHAVEEASGLPYIAMQYVDGMSLQERLDRSGALELEEILRIGMQTASGLAAAHAQGLIHRDIKPANILLENGVERVKITDFGLARAAADASLSQSGVVAGTPQYMAPEQARGEAVDQRADLFSLGSVLYAMCTGRAPFRASGSMAVLKRVCEETPTPVRETNPTIPDWLVAIIDKLHAKDPAERYQLAAEVAELLSRHLAHVQHPSVAPLPAMVIPASGGREPADSAGSAGGSRPPLAHRRRWAVAAAVLLLLLGGLSLTEATGVTNLQATVIRILTPDGTLVVEVDDPDVKVTIDGEEISITGAGAREVRLRPGQYRFVATKDGKPVRKELVTITRGDKQVVKVSLEATGLANAIPQEQPLAPGEIRRFVGHTEGVQSVAISSDGRRILSGSDDKTVRLWDLKTGKELGRFEGHSDKVNSVAFSADGRRVLSGSFDLTVRLWDVETRKELRCFTGHTDIVACVAYSPDGRRALTGSNDKTLRLWDVENGKELRRFEGHTREIYSVAFSPDGRRALSGGWDKSMRLWDVENGKELRRFEGHTHVVKSVAFSPDGRRALSAGGTDNTVRLWDVETGKELRRFEGHRGWAHGVAFSPDGLRAVSGGTLTVYLWDVQSGRLLQSFVGHTSEVASVAFSPDGRHALSAGWDGDNTLRLWQLPEAGSGQAPQAEPGAFVPRAVLEGHGSWLQSLTFSPDGKTLATGSNDQHVRLWDTETGDLTGVFHADDGVITSLAYSPDGTVLVAASNQWKVRVWDAATFNLLAEAKHGAGVRAVAFRPGDSMLATASEDATVKLWKWDGAALVHHRTLPEHASRVDAMSFNPQGTMIASATWDGMLYLWDVESGEPLKSVRLGWQPLACVAFSPDGMTIAAGGYDKTVELRKAETLESVGTLRGHKETVRSLVFLDDGNTLVSAGALYDVETQRSNRPGELKLWDVAGLAERLSVDGYETGVLCLALSRDGKTLATGDFARGRLWDVGALLAAAFERKEKSESKQSGR